MSFNLGRGRTLDDAPGVVGVLTAGPGAELPPLPDAALQDPRAGFVDLGEWFAPALRSSPLELEIGCGKGTFLLEAARRAPGTRFLGIEWAREFYLYTADRVRRAGLANVRVLHADASEFLRWRCPDGCLGVVHLYFSDPWPKAKHHKNRVVQHRFLAEVWRTLVPGGELRVVTDHDELWAWNTDHFASWTTPGGAVPPALRASHALPALPFDLLPFSAPPWVGEGQAVGTNYERKKCVEPGKPPHAAVLRKRA